jgi:hypothetical protein
VVEEPTIIPAAFVPLPATLFAVLVLPPNVPKSVTVKLGSALTQTRLQIRTPTAAKLTLIGMFMGA